MMKLGTKTDFHLCELLKQNCHFRGKMKNRGDRDGHWFLTRLTRLDSDKNGTEKNTAVFPTK